MERKAPSDPTFHPSRDTPHRIGDETSTGQQVLLDQGEGPRRENLFGGNSARDIGNTSRLRPQGTERDVEILSDHVLSLGNTSVPTTHWTADRSPIDVRNEGMERAGGYYRPASDENPTPTVAIDTATTHSRRTLVHEMGHAHHYTEVTNEAERDNPTKEYHDTRGYSPDPLQEAVADAYVDRYGGLLSAAKTADDYSHISNRQFGYSTNFEQDRAQGGAGAWDPGDRTLYAGTRAHFGETGEIPRYQEAPSAALDSRASADATIAHLHEHSPHARAAWNQLSFSMRVPATSYAHSHTVDQPLSDLASQAVRRHNDRRLLSQGQFVQESLFGEPEMARNQQGEQPRTEADLRGSLGDWEVNMQGRLNENKLRGFD